MNPDALYVRCSADEAPAGKMPCIEDLHSKSQVEVWYTQLDLEKIHSTRSFMQFSGKHIGNSNRSKK